MSKTGELRTNRDLYLLIADLHETNADSNRTLAEYLRALWQLGGNEREQAALSLPRFAELLEDASGAAAPQFEPTWSDTYHRDASGLSGFRHWESTILKQIVDLHEMEHAGTLANELRYLGVDAPRGSRWFNFDPLTFLECAVAGTFHGWRSGDPTGRELVPGRVAVLDGAGQITSVDPSEIQDPTCEIGAISWETFAEFLMAGQWYE